MRHSHHNRSRFRHQNASKSKSGHKSKSKHNPYLHGVGGAVGEAPYGVVGAVGVLEGCGEGDPAREVPVPGDGEGALERADA